jgi:outer membrane protein OmpA-like peptidoglycan-associated protein
MGATGAQGAVGVTGAQGVTTAGLVGAVGRVGEAGAQGVVGATGAEGYTKVGVAGPAGRAGEVGAQGRVGEAGAQGATGVVSLWTLYRDIRFDYNRSDLRASEVNKIGEIAQYIRANPSLKIGLDGSMDPNGTDPRNQSLSDLLVKVIRDALVKAGVPASSIESGAFGDSRLVADRRVAVLLRTKN